MKGKFYTYIGLCLLMGMAFSAVSLEIQNVDTEAGTLDIYMVNDEEVGGFQFELFGIDITGASGGSAGTAGFMISTSPSTILGFSITGATIPVDSDVLLQVTFENHSGGEICFGEDTGGAGNNTISSAIGTYIAASWGTCFCPSGLDTCGDCGGNNTENCFEDGIGCEVDDDCASDVCDSCGVCGGTGIPEGYCDCDGNVIDCAGECGGSAVEDDCGICNGDNSSCSDCNGDLNGDAYIDNCGICVGGTTELEACSVDCLGVYNGPAVPDECGVCNGDNSSCTDCNGDVNGTAYIDACENCVMGNTGNNACLFDCDGQTPFNEDWAGPGASDNCGVCDSTPENDCEMDCAGAWGGSGSFDACGICNGDGSSCADCAGIPNGENVIDNCGNCDADPDNDCVTDCAGIWGGDSEVDACGICGGDNSSCTDECGVVNGDNSTCLDCAGDPNGTAYTDNCGECVGGSTGLPACYQDCDGEWGGTAYIDFCGECVGGETEKTACIPDCLGVWGGPALWDECGVCDGPGAIYECGCEDIAVGACDCVGNTLDECEVCGGDGSTCLETESWTNLSLESGDNQITLTWESADGGQQTDSGDDSSQSDEDELIINAPIFLDIDAITLNPDSSGTAEILMLSQAGCRYWEGTNEVFETIDATACADLAGTFYDGAVGGFQFELLDVIISGATGGSAAEYLDNVNTSPDKVLAFSMTGGFIPPGEGLLTEVTFSSFTGNEVCFGESIANNAISDAVGGAVWTEWGDCFCLGVEDECGVCDGPGIAEGACDCEGNLPDFTCPEGTALAGDIVCAEAECAGISYNVYRDGAASPHANVETVTQYIDAGLGYSESHCYTVTYVSGGNESDPSDQVCGETNPMPAITGCMSVYACNFNAEATIEDGSCWFANNGCSCDDGEGAEIDCAGECNGGAAFDDCGMCTGGSTNLTPNYFKDCNGVCGGTAQEDCSGVCGGNSYLDNCGTCDDDIYNDCPEDCAGVDDGAATLDNCGVCICNGQSSEEGSGCEDVEPCEQDCSGVWGGSGVLDLFGDCCLENCILTGCDLPDTTYYLSETGLEFNSSKEIKRILITLHGITIQSSPVGGEAGDAQFLWNFVGANNNAVVGQSLGGNTIPASCGTLFELDYIGSLFFLESEMIGSNNAAIPFTYYSEVGCMDESFCNYNPHATEQPEGACFEIDECGICGGGGPTEGFDCDGNELSLYNGMIPEMYEIKSVYPNPFNPVSNLIYGIPENAHLEVMVFDIRGRKIESLYKGFQFAGYHEISWDASQEPSGVYLVKILSENFTDTRKIILMK